MTDFMFRPKGRVHQLCVDGELTKFRISKTAVGYSVWSREGEGELVLRAGLFDTLPDAMAEAINQWSKQCG
jgi:hypothetical protein